LKIDHRPPRWDESTNLWFSERSYQLVKEFKILAALDTLGATRPNFIPFLQSFSYFIIGHSTKAAIFLSNSGSLLLIYVSIFILGKMHFSRLAGLLGSILFTCYHGIMLWSRYYNLDMPLTALTSVTVLLSTLIYNNGFKSTKLSLSLGLTLAVGICAKHLYAAFVLLPLGLLYLFSFKRNGRTLKSLIYQNKTFYILGGLGILAGLAYHALNYQTFIELLKRAVAPHTTSLTTLGFNPPPIGQILNGFLNFELGHYAWGLLFLVGLAFSLFSLSRSYLFILAWLLGGFLLLFLVIQVTMPYYFHPILPAFALVSFAWVRWTPSTGRTVKRIGLQAVKATAIVAIAVFCIGNYLEKSLGTRNIFTILSESPQVLFTSKRMEINPFVNKPYWINAYVDGNIATLPYPHYWPVEEMLREIEKVINSRAVLQNYRLALLTNYEWMTGDFVRYKLLQLRQQDQIQFYLPLPPPCDRPIEEFLEEYDFVIIKTGKILKNDFYGLAWADQSQEFVDLLTVQDYKLLKENDFRLLCEFPLPDGSKGSVWMSRSRLSSYSLIDALPFAERSVMQPGYVSTSTYNIDGDKRLVLFLHPSAPPAVTEIRWKNIPIPPRARLVFGITISPDTWLPDHGDGVEFVVDITSGGMRRRLFRKYIDPKNNAAERHWQDHEISLDEFAGQKVDVILSTTAGPGGNLNYDHAGWSGLRIETPEEP
jgi:hypothetical protein